MDFEKAVSLVGTIMDLRRIASAHVIDHSWARRPGLPHKHPSLARRL
jgi:hypothetical protein